MKKLLLEINGKEETVWAQKISGELWFHYQGDTYQYVPESKLRNQSSGAGASDPLKIVAPMPGKILKVFKASGDDVSEGETIIAMEAMKMEYNLKAQGDLSVNKINCKEGDQVAVGDLLVDLKENS